jgi:hypothetical protein
MDDGELMYLMGTKELAFDNYGVSITDGKKEKDILQKMEGLFPQEINAGMLRSKDVARFWMESSFAAALRVLDNAHDELAKVRENEIKAKQEGDKYATDASRQTAIEDREDGQNHDKEMELLRTEGKKEVAQLSGSFKLQQDASKDAAKAMMPQKSALTTP